MISTLSLQGATKLDNNAMKDVTGGSTLCYVRCNQHVLFGYYVADCERSTVEAVCGPDLSNAVCTQTTIEEAVVE